MRELLRRAWHLIRRRRFDADLREELEFHRAAIERELTEGGANPTTVPFAARRAMGSLALAHEQARDVWAFVWVEQLAQDTRHAFRALWRNPAFSLITILTLAVGIGATTAIFSLVDAVWIRSLPYADTARLAYVGTWNPKFADIARAVRDDFAAGALPPSTPDFQDLQITAHSFSSLALMNQQSLTLETSDVPIRLTGTRVSSEFFRTLGVAPQLGRALDATDAYSGDANVAVISHALWQSQFGGDGHIVGRTLRLNGKSYRVIGVMPRGFAYPATADLGVHAQGPTDVWIPKAVPPAEPGDRDLPDSDAAIGRLLPNVSVQQAQTELNTLFAGLNEGHSPEWRGWYPIVTSFNEVVLSRTRPLISLIFGAVALVLLIACSNAANLLLARGLSRTHEMGIRAALGAGAFRLIRHALTEALVLALGGGLVGLGLAYGAVHVLPLIDPGSIPRLNETAVDRNALFFSLALSVGTALVFGFAPAIATARVGIENLLESGGSRSTRPSHRLPRVLIVAEVAMATALVAGSALLIHSYINLQRVDRGFLSSTLTVRLSADARRYTEAVQPHALYRTLLDRIRALPGVVAAGATSTLPLSHSEEWSFFLVNGYPNRESQTVHTRAVTAQFFDAMGTRLVAGRALNDDDVTGRPRVVVVNETFARTYFPGRSAIGQQYRLVDPDKAADKRIPWSRIVGVVADVRQANLEDPPPATAYASYWQDDYPDTSLYIAARTTLPPASVASAIRKTVYGLDPLVVVADVHVMSDRVGEATSQRRFETSLLTGFAVIAIGLAAIGLYGLLAYRVKQRTQEIGIRLALGAQTRDVRRLIVGEAIALTSLGVAWGLAGSLGLARLLQGLLYGVTRTDPLGLATALIVLVGAALAAASVPAWRASRVDPIIALRAE